jgi:selenocysteine lyase/cysteine desulfurase
MAYDVERIRGHFPSLATGMAYFDGPGGTQVSDVVGDAMAGTVTAAIANRGTVTAAERRDSADAYRFLAARGVNAPAGSFYALEASRWLGLGDDGAVRAGLAPYSIADDIDRLVDGVTGFIR